MFLPVEVEQQTVTSGFGMLEQDHVSTVLTPIHRLVYSQSSSQINFDEKVTKFPQLKQCNLKHIQLNKSYHMVCYFQKIVT